MNLYWITISEYCTRNESDVAVSIVSLFYITMFLVATRARARRKSKISHYMRQKAEVYSERIMFFVVNQTRWWRRSLRLRRRWWFWFWFAKKQNENGETRRERRRKKIFLICVIVLLNLHIDSANDQIMCVRHYPSTKPTRERSPKTKQKNRKKNSKSVYETRSSLSLYSPLCLSVYESLCVSAMCVFRKISNRMKG